MKKKSVILGLVFGLFFLITAAQAGIIEQTAGTAGRGLEFYRPGQTFTAEDALIDMISFEFSCSTILTPASSLEVNLYEWDSDTDSLGALVSSAPNSTTLPVFQGGFSWVEFDFTGTALTVGEEYAAFAVDPPPENDPWGYLVRWNTVSDEYTGGTALFGINGVAPTPARDGYDLNFRVTPVPVPAAVWLLGSGLIGLIGIRRRSKKTI
jgi:hypothetical protein